MGGIIRAHCNGPIKPWKAAYDRPLKSGIVTPSGSWALGSVVYCQSFVLWRILSRVRLRGSTITTLGRAFSFEMVTYNLTVVSDRSVAVLGWTGGDNGPAAEFVRSFDKLSPRDKSEGAIRLGFEHVENLYMKPTWWASLPEPLRTTVLARLPSGGSEVSRRPECLKPDDFLLRRRYRSGRN